MVFETEPIRTPDAVTMFTITYTLSASSVAESLCRISPKLRWLPVPYGSGFCEKPCFVTTTLGATSLVVDFVATTTNEPIAVITDLQLTDQRP